MNELDMSKCHPDCQQCSIDQQADPQYITILLEEYQRLKRELYAYMHAEARGELIRVKDRQNVFPLSGWIKDYGTVMFVNRVDVTSQVIQRAYYRPVDDSFQDYYRPDEIYTTKEEALASMTKRK